MNWKTLSIILMILLVLETSFIAWGYYLVTKEESQIKECYYDICEDYPQAWFENEICYCYDYGLTGEYVVAKTKYMD